MARIESLGGEGLMLRQPGSAYEVGRSCTLLKVKTFHDAEAFVVDHQGGKGKLAKVLNQGTALADWLGEQDPDVAPLISGLQRLGSKVARAGYFDMLELERDADKLTSSCDHTRRSRSGGTRMGR